MRRRRAAAPYAKALFALAKERNQTELVGRELDAVAATLESDLALRDSPLPGRGFRRRRSGRWRWRSRGDRRAHVRTAVPSDEERGQLSAKLGQALGGRQVVLTEVVDRAMLGGFVVESGSIVLDGSLEGQLERMRRRLASG